MKVTTKRYAVTAHSESDEEAEMLLSLRSGSAIAKRKRGYTAFVECGVCNKPLKNPTGLAVHMAKVHPQKD